MEPTTANPDPRFPFMKCAPTFISAGQMERVLGDFIRKYNIAVEELTEKQIAAALLQAIECGDFTRQVRVTDNAQSVIYIPFMREQELESRIRRLEAALKQHGIADPDAQESATE